MQRPKLYLNPIFSKLRTQLFCILMMNRVHPQAPRAFQVQGPIIDKKTLFRLALCDLQGHTKNHLFGLPGSKVTGAEENEKIFAKMESFNAVLVELQRFIIDGADEGISQNPLPWQEPRASPGILSTERT